MFNSYFGNFYKGHTIVTFFTFGVVAIKSFRTLIIFFQSSTFRVIKRIYRNNLTSPSIIHVQNSTNNLSVYHKKQN